MKKALQVGLAILGIVVGFIAVTALREAMLSTHQHVPRNSQIEVLLTAHSKNAERTQSLAEMVEAQLLSCRLEVNSDLVGDIEDQGDGHFRAVMSPTLDETNRRQFRGCVEDWAIDQLRVNVTGLERIENRTD